MNLSIIMAYKPDGGIRDRHCSWTAKRYKIMFPDAEIIISTDNESSIGSKWDGFCKAKYINQGVERSTRDNILITDIDVVFIKNAIVNGLGQVKQHSFVLPFTTIYYLNKSATVHILSNQPRKTIPKVDLSKYKKQVRIGLKPNGMHMMTKKSWERSGGYDERYTGWGSEDYAFLIALVTMNDLPELRLDMNCYHLWHPLDKTRHGKRDRRVGILTERYRQAKFNRELMEKLIKERENGN